MHKIHALNGYIAAETSQVIWSGGLVCVETFSPFVNFVNFYLFILLVHHSRRTGPQKEENFRTY